MDTGGESSQELERLRRKNRKLEEDLKLVSDHLQNKSMRANQTETDLNKRLINEIEYMKGNPDIITRPGSKNMSSNQDTELIRKERNELQEENRRLVQMLKDSKKWDTYLLQRDNERLVKAVNILNYNIS